VSSITESITQIKNQIAAAATQAGMKTPPLLLAVSKVQPNEKIEEAYRAGQKDFGENYVQELIEKETYFRQKNLRDLRFHFIGHLQTNKVKSLLPHVDTIHSVDSVKLLKEIEKRGNELQCNVRCYFQINIDGEATKSGFDPLNLTELKEVAGRCRFVIPAGLMCIPDPEKNTEDAYRRMKALSEKHSAVLGGGLSMGMSPDFEKAILNGATVVRVGTAIFGERKI
jgi:pyridoxal phosphate enzyme (YggS family)